MATKKSETSKASKISWLALIIALVGGVPGLLTIKDHWERSNVKIGFDSNNSVFVPIDSKKAFLENKIALLLYRMTITGKGSQPAYIREIRLQVRVDDKWLDGNRFSPRTGEPHNTLPYKALK